MRIKMTVIETRALESIVAINNKIPNMTLRDYFAGQVLAGMGEYLMNNKDSIDEISETCYRIADSMIERRKNYEKS